MLTQFTAMALPPLFFIEDLGDLFYTVQGQKVFPDSKFFSDASPRGKVATIIADYEKLKGAPDFDLTLFITTHFILPPELTTGYISANKPLREHLEELWTVLKRMPAAVTQQSTLIPLPYPYIVPGGRFREIFYWDTYFTMLGLQVSKQVELIQNMVDNFAYLIDTIGHIPNGNRTYFISRSQPPFFVLMVELLAAEKGDAILQQYLPQLEKEYAFWMEGVEQLSSNHNAHRRVVQLPDGTILNRYWDDKDYTRPEAFFEDGSIAQRSGRPVPEVQRHLRAACESGWDFSSRWLRDGATMDTIETTNIIPVDLNCLLLHVEEVLLKLYTQQNNQVAAQRLQAAAHRRYAAIQQYCWNEAHQFYFDYHFTDQKNTSRLTLAAVYPLFFRVATAEQATAVAALLEKEFLCDGGLITTPVTSNQQWDAPNGWAPLQWLAYKGLQQYGFNELANKVRDRWTANCEKVYTDTGKMMEKYNVADISTKAAGGKYPNQDGFGWTNGVYLRMKAEDPQAVQVV